MGFSSKLHRQVLHQEIVPKFTKYEFEWNFYNLLKAGDGKKIAEKIGLKPKMLNQYFCPSDERENPLHRAAKMLAAWIEIDEQLGSQALRAFINFVKRSFPNEDHTPTGVSLVAITKAERYLEDAKRAIVLEAKRVA